MENKPNIDKFDITILIVNRLKTSKIIEIWAGACLQAEGHWFEPSSSHTENEAIRGKTLIAFFICTSVAQAVRN